MSNKKKSNNTAEDNLKAFGAAAYSQGSIATTENLLPLATQLLKQSEALVAALKNIQEASENTLEEAKKSANIKVEND